MTRLLKVSRSGYYKWANSKRVTSHREQQYSTIDERIMQEWEESDRTYGAFRITACLHEQGIAINVKTVAKRMRLLGIEGISPRRFRPCRSITGKSVHRIPDRVERQFDPGKLNHTWLSDITYLRTKEGWLYLCAVRDGHSRRVIGWAMDTRQTADLVIRALRQAYVLRGCKPGEVIFHADRGTQYTSEEVYQYCKQVGIYQSMGRTGVCFDNAMAESFWSTLKTEYYSRHRWATRDQARREVARWIEQTYNRKRKHSSIGMQPPVTFELQQTITKTAQIA